MHIKVIKTEADYEAAMAQLMTLMDQEIAPGSEEENQLELLELVIGDYESQHYPAEKPDPVEAILFRMDQQNLTQKDLIPFIGSKSKVSEVLSRKRPLSLAMIRGLHEGLGIPAEVLIQAAPQPGMDLSAAPTLDYSKFPLPEMYERGCFGKLPGGVSELRDYAEEKIVPLLRELCFEEAQPALLRAPMHQGGGRTMDEYALLAWRICVLKKASEQTFAANYVPGTITPEWLRDLAKLSRFETGPVLAREYLADHGIALVIEPHFKKTYLDGAAMLCDGRPVIGLTLRHDRVDNFWFALMHELAHVQLHLSAIRGFIADSLDDKSRSSQEERDADQAARDALIPPEVWATAKARTSRAPEDAIALARQLHIHGAIVAGRVRHETGNWRLLSGLIGKKGDVSRAFAAV
ncbi:MAG: transcriptional regulator [Candidatus Melainabacteria bacterium HGW-Melainabacteria-1]|nr:MAG: transcriptional regulator [Candidatus Melainabacteria bacterium HGW-Melainabacteria-1]